ncbi:uncharacterized protein LOC119995460 isoform X1 [Tripterygium wilfordii]|uniref:uncharacterized protein LOC119982639 n=1 Tax=Tripterygium wilfordii TaxID=458696 RepID=UPI0018F80402|nr:uncharacterized protein LOC119982639 [Tripterygium wilfordii]XP_038691909.1 uncharacterized protein LOC119990136 [Tripterygium wilfordii]XP_038697898.1 uncharacterized protein LOC119995459 [Tripterygium wilfordii]XP_038697899.1 uncharacterized protein LOC119995460 isoform X1 [Tripterygium wilfordii]
MIVSRPPLPPKPDLDQDRFCNRFSAPTRIDLHGFKRFIFLAAYLDLDIFAIVIIFLNSTSILTPPPLKVLQLQVLDPKSLYKHEFILLKRLLGTAVAQHIESL